MLFKGELLNDFELIKGWISWFFRGDVDDLVIV